MTTFEEEPQARINLLEQKQKERDNKTLSERNNFLALTYLITGKQHYKKSKHYSHKNHTNMH